MSLKKFSNKFELPIIKDKIPKVINREMDTSPYDGVFILLFTYTYIYTYYTYIYTYYYY